MTKRLVLLAIVAMAALAAIIVGLALGRAAYAATSARAATAVKINGTNGNDRLVGTKGNDVINGRGGNDSISGGPGNDTLNGGPGNDVVSGGAGADRITCGSGRDKVLAGPGDTVAADCENVSGLPKPAVSVSDAQVVEGNSGTATLPFVVTLHKASTKPVSVGYATADGTATAGSDYLAASGTVAFKPGEMSKTINVTVNGDTTIEPDETLTLSLSNPVNAKLATASATGTISTDDKSPHAGHYSGQTSQGHAISFDVSADSKGLSNLSFSVDLPCSDPSVLPLSLAGQMTIGDDRTLSGTFSGRSGSNIWAGSIKGSFDPATGAGSGTLSVFDAVNTSSGAVICASGTLTWTAA